MRPLEKSFLFIIVFITIFFMINSSQFGNQKEISDPSQGGDAQDRKVQSDISTKPNPLPITNGCDEARKIYGLYYEEPIRRIIRHNFPGQAAVAGRADLFRLFEYNPPHECSVLNKIEREPGREISQGDREVVFSSLKYLWEQKLIIDKQAWRREIRSRNEELANLFFIRYGEHWTTGSTLPLPIVFTKSKLIESFYREMEYNYTKRTGIPGRLESQFGLPREWIRALGVEFKHRDKRSGWGADLVEQYYLLKNGEIKTGKHNRQKLVDRLHKSSKERIDDYLHALLAIPVLRGSGELSFPVDRNGDCYILPIIVADLNQLNSTESNDFIMLLDLSQPVPPKAFEEQDLRSIAMRILGNRHDFDTLLDYCYVSKKRSSGQRAGDFLQQFEERTDAWREADRG